MIKGGSSLSYASCVMTTCRCVLDSGRICRQALLVPSEIEADRGMYTCTYPAKYILSEKCLMATCVSRQKAVGSVLMSKTQVAE